MSSKRNGRKTIHANQISREGGNGIWFLWLLVISSTSNTNQMSWSKVGMVYVLWRLAISSTSSSISNTGVSFRMLKWLVKRSHFQSLSDSFSPKHDEKELGWVFRSSPVLHTAMIHSCSQAVYDPTNYIRHGDWAKYSTVICLLPVKNEKKRNKDEDANQDLYNHSKNKTIAIYQKPQLNLRGRHLSVCAPQDWHCWNIKHSFNFYTLKKENEGEKKWIYDTCYPCVGFCVCGLAEVYPFTIRKNCCQDWTGPDWTSPVRPHSSQICQSTKVPITKLNWDCLINSKLGKLKEVVMKSLYVWMEDSIEK